MKKLLVVMSAFLLICLMGFTQKITPEKVPVPVKKAFATKFPAATDAKFELVNNYYNVVFNDKGVGTTAKYSPSGKWLITETSISESDLPKEVSASLAKDFADFKISAVTKVESPDKPLFYTMDLQKEKEGYNAQFSPKGDVLKKTPLKK
jgi:Putative beta-lactamase-inhibitor-like, PepSY-like